MKKYDLKSTLAIKKDSRNNFPINNRQNVLVYNQVKKKTDSID